MLHLFCQPCMAILVLLTRWLGAVASPEQCGQHDSISECIVFRNQHGCVWDTPSKACVSDTPCDKRSQSQCLSELTTGVAADWDKSHNKCIWDQHRQACRWADECFGHSSSKDCVLAHCSWKKLCTPVDMRSFPGPGQCRESCAAPDASTGASRLTRSSSRRLGSMASPPVSLSDVVATVHGDIQGFRDGDVQSFLGVPFAQAPVGTLRWAPPQPLSTEKWSGTYMATEPGPSCMQEAGYYFTDPEACQGFTRGKCLGYSEDCLNLNVWTKNTSASKAVMVWIHGGCFVSGSANSASFAGTNMAAAKDLVMVALQYRLGAFGWLGDDLLRPRDPAGSTGNYGLMDNIAALKWIQVNIASMGGDPAKVTIFGESSGAGSVSQLLGVPAAWPYFHKGIMESGTGSFWTYMNIDAAYTNFEKVTTATLCNSSKNTVSCLLNASTSTVSSAVSSVPCRDGCKWTPVIDGIFVTGQTVDLARAGRLRPNTPTISGFNLNDGAMFVPDWKPASASMSQSQLTQYFSSRFGIERVETLAQIFPVLEAVEPSWLSPYFFSAQECETDFSYACTAQWVSNASVLHGSSSYVYQFSEPTSHNSTLVLHGDEIRYVFGTLTSPSAQQSQVSSLTMGFWSNFAKTGDPNGAGLPDWPKWDATAPVLNITAAPLVMHFPQNSFAGCSFFESNWDYYGGCLPENPPLSGHSIFPAVLI